MSRARMIAAACAALSLCAAAPAQAGADRTPQPYSEITPEAEALGVRLAHQFFSTAKVGSWWTQRLSRPLTAQKTFKIKWEAGGEAALSEAVIEEMYNDLPALERLAGREFARGMPLDQLKANVEFLEGSAGRQMLALVFDQTMRETAPESASLKETGLQIVRIYKPELNFTRASDDNYQRIRNYLAYSHEGQTLMVLLNRAEDRMETLMLAELTPGVVARYEAKMAPVRAARPAAGGKR
ncbi:hypothetical protein [Caulobacter sp. 17J65-9]|uniref:hypothetical protein n=1 Tax=Caulobacter sp. 17J65-9 TaxID=2709382 RepID=UPI0013C94994|nr:hypothetical protein [Caulobacter sp. 17J65-9]NEX93879.1 hypothetical protein [Caulobacter sp. 17J65-9]